MGCALARKVPAQKLKAVVALIALCAGLQLVWSGVHALGTKSAGNSAHVTLTKQTIRR